MEKTAPDDTGWPGRRKRVDGLRRGDEDEVLRTPTGGGSVVACGNTEILGAVAVVIVHELEKGRLVEAVGAQGPEPGAGGKADVEVGVRRQDYATASGAPWDRQAGRRRRPARARRPRRNRRGNCSQSPRRRARASARGNPPAPACRRCDRPPKSGSGSLTTAGWLRKGPASIRRYELPLQGDAPQRSPCRCWPRIPPRYHNPARTRPRRSEEQAALPAARQRRRLDMARSISRWLSRFFESSRLSHCCLPCTSASSAFTRPFFS